MNISILGAGAMGSALAILLAKRNSVMLWGSEYDLELLEKIKNGGEHPRIQAKLPENVEILYPQELEKVVTHGEIIVLAVSTAGIKPMTEKIKPLISPNKILVTVTKGLIDEGERILTVAEYLEKHIPCSIIAISGPSIAREVANKNFTKVVFSSKDREALEKCKNSFETEYYRIETTSDIIGCELCSALKNIYSIILAWPRGLEKTKKVKMSNLLGVLVSKALEEISYIVEKFGGEKQTVYGLSGIGDIICTIGSGRNGMFGELLGEGKTAEEALSILREKGVGVIEGYENLPKVKKLVQDFENELPLFNSLCKVIYGNKKVEDVIKQI